MEDTGGRGSKLADDKLRDPKPVRAAINTPRQPTREEKKKLKKAAFDGDINTLQQLITSGVNVTGIVEDQSTPLHFASQDGHSSIVEILIKHGADVNAVAVNQSTPLYIASQNGHSSIVEILIKHGADVNAVAVHQWTPLHIASQNGHSSTVEILIKHGADVNAVNKDQSTPLYIASQNDRISIVEILIKHGADVKAVNKLNRTPLECAVWSNHSNIVYYFINELKMDVTQFDQDTQQKVSELLKAEEQSSPERKENSHDEQEGSPNTQQEPNMKWMHKVVIPEVSHCWRTIADYLEYPLAKKKEIEERQHGDPRKCCAELMEDWLSSDRGVGPRTWDKLMSVLKEVGELSSSVTTIERRLLKEGLL